MSTPIKITRGTENKLPTEITDGQIYFCADTGNLYIDTTLGRIHISSDKAKNIIYNEEIISGEQIRQALIDIGALQALMPQILIKRWSDQEE